MKLIYAPENGGREEYDFNPSEISSVYAEPLEEVGGNVWADWEGFLRALDAGKTRAKRAALWHCQRLERPEVLFDEVVILPHEVVLAMQEADIEKAREFYMSDRATPEQREQFLAVFGEPGKDDDSETSDAPTDGESLEPDSES